ncbi:MULTISPECIES: hypothetical protein [Reichenbachiella]|uniref:Anti-sigma factor n=1 Tax=Reichenbachiella agariperforans TaxID=156994 RepID=A0A1M6WRZ5_REIAG|nr:MULTISPECIES: hypothetical protein [Reichenbachiella]MBU2914792.1 hypothetical protein [Reichenbachiella agariperforans]RJE71181.1 hypothetical protein BGP76_08490 [Reichenbachiella sp. MSK19-1]SHK96431.1 hypothetical protein SAMN04488028_11437 [Reichenbachiella agariperforans]
MERDDLKRFVEETRGAFDVHELDTDLWSGIEGKLGEAEQKHRVMSWRGVRRYVAVVLVLVVSSAGILGWLSEPSNNYERTELTEVESYYQNKIDIKVSKISALEADKQILEGLDLLDQSFMELKEDLKDNADNEEVINAMISTYQVKLQILERILDELEEKKQKIDA